MADETRQESPFIPLQERMKATLAKNVLLARRAKYISQKDLAEKAGLSRVALAQIETAQADPMLSIITDLAIALNINPFLLLLGEADYKVLMEMSEEFSV